MAKGRKEDGYDLSEFMQDLETQEEYLNSGEIDENTVTDDIMLDDEMMSTIIEAGDEASVRYVEPEAIREPEEEIVETYVEEEPEYEAAEPYAEEDPEEEIAETYVEEPARDESYGNWSLRNKKHLDEDNYSLDEDAEEDEIDDDYLEEESDYLDEDDDYQEDDIETPGRKSSSLFGGGSAGLSKKKIGIIVGVGVLLIVVSAGAAVALANRSNKTKVTDASKKTEKALNDTSAPVVRIKTDIRVIVGQELSSDAVIEAMTDESQIVKVEFRDNSVQAGSLDSKKKLQPASCRYDAVGDVTNVLLVTDAEGNTSETEVAIYVTEDYAAKVQGMKDRIVDKGAENVDFMQGLEWDPAIVAAVECDSSNVNIGEVGEYKIVYTIRGNDANDSIGRQATEAKVTCAVKVVEKQNSDTQNSNSGSTSTGGTTNSGYSYSGGTTNSGYSNSNTSNDSNDNNTSSQEPATENPGSSDNTQPSEPSNPETPDQGGSDSGTTDSGTSNPGTTDPGTTDPGTSDSGASNPGTDSSGASAQ